MRALLLLMVLLATSCSSRVECWYSVGLRQEFGEPWYGLRGRTPPFNSEVYGPLFKTQAELQAYIQSQGLMMCGRADHADFEKK